MPGPSFSGSGIQNDPYLIHTPAEFNDIRNYITSGTYYKLVANIDLSAYDSWVPIGDSVTPYNAYLDGNGFTISNMNITSAIHNTDGAYVGLFGYMSIGTIETGSYSVKNLILNSCSINLNNYSIASSSSSPNTSSNSIFAGILAGTWKDISFPSSSSDWNRIENVRVKNSNINLIKSNISGSNEFTESLSEIYIGGLIGLTQLGLITSSSVNLITITGIVSSSFGEASSSIGGFSNSYTSSTGQFTYDSVKNSYINFENKISGSGTWDSHSISTAISGFGNLNITSNAHDLYVYNTVVSGTIAVSGFSDTILVDETALSNIDVDFPSGKSWTNARYGNTPTESVYNFSRVYGESETSSSQYNYFETGSIVYPNDYSPNGMSVIPLSQSQMLNSASYTGFDFQNVWTINPSINTGYPYLLSEQFSLSVISPNGGESYLAGNNIPVSWSLNGISSRSIDVQYSSDSGSTWFNITSSIISTEGTNSFSWTAPSTTSMQYLIQVISGSIFDISDATFSIFTPFSIGGFIVSSSGNPISGAMVSFTNGGGNYSSDINGNYNTDTFTSSYTGTSTATLANYSFSPISRSYNNASGNLSDEAFTGSFTAPASSFIISGGVFVSGTNNPIPGVLLSMNPGNPLTIQFYTDANGQYSRSVNPGFSGQITASHDYYSITPSIISYTNVTSSYDSKIYSGSLITYEIAGTILSSSGDPVESVTMSNDKDGAVSYTDVNGDYSQSFTQSFSVTVTPMYGTAVFSPGHKTYNNLSSGFTNQNYTMYSVITASSGLNTYYDSRIAYNTASDTWFDISGKGKDIVTYNTYYTANKNLAFGLDFLGISTASFYGIQVSSSFAVEMRIAPDTSSGAKTLLSTEYNTFPYLLVYVTASKLFVNYKYNSAQTVASEIISDGISEAKYNHIAVFVSGSKIYSWVNGTYYQNTNITESSWNGATIGLNTSNNDNEYKGFIDIIKIWNGLQIDIDSINEYYLGRDYWKDLESVEFTTASPLTTFSSIFITSSMMSYVGISPDVISSSIHSSSVESVVGTTGGEYSSSFSTSSLVVEIGKILPPATQSLLNNYIFYTTGSSTNAYEENLIHQAVELQISGS